MESYNQPSDNTTKRLSQELLDDVDDQLSDVSGGDTTQAHEPAPFGHGKWELRPGARQHVFIRSAWIDRDESGDYDPRAKVTRQAKKQRINQTIGNSTIEQARNPKQLSWLAARQRGVPYGITIKLDSAQGKALLAKFPQSWPDEPWNMFTENDQIEQTCDEPYLFRKRDFAKTEKEEDDFTGHPEARGCKACYKAGLQCPLLDTDSTYPCYICIEDDCPCEPLVAPKHKRVCKNCEKSKIECSYSLIDWGNHQEPCYQCAVQKSSCIAWPAKDPTRCRLPIDKNLIPAVLGTHQALMTCEPCRQDGHWCTLQTQSGARPCHQCKVRMIACTLEVVKKEWQGWGPYYHLKGEGSGEPPKIDRSTLSTEQLKNTTFIVTKFAHPITFLHEPDIGGKQPCQWCSNPFYAIFGYDEKTVEVYEQPNGAGYIEIAGGHTLSGCEPTRVCKTHTLEKLSIRTCRNHRLTRMNEKSTYSKDYLMAFNRLMEYHGGPEENPIYEWCSFCTQLAKYECCNSKPVAQPLAPSTSLSERGCGLRLCPGCTFTLAQTYDNDLQAMVACREANKDQYEYGIRADTSFLDDCGPLFNFAQRGGSAGSPS